MSENRNNENDKRSERTGAWKIQEQEKTNRPTTAQTVVAHGSKRERVTTAICKKRKDKSGKGGNGRKCRGR